MTSDRTACLLTDIVSAVLLRISFLKLKISVELLATDELHHNDDEKLKRDVL